MEIFYTHRAVRDLENLPVAVQRRIAKKMRFFAEQKDPIRFGERLTDYREGEFRFRIGEYRTIFDVANGRIFILKIKKRDKAYD